MGLRKWYDRHVMPRLVTAACGQEGIEKRRREVVPLAQGRVFEIGCGGGFNQALYDSDKVTSFAGIDPHAKLLDGARARALAKGWETDIRQGVGEDIPFADGSFDTVVCTYTLCSVDDPARPRVCYRKSAEFSHRAGSCCSSSTGVLQMPQWRAGRNG